MSSLVKLRKGLDIRLKGKADNVIKQAGYTSKFAVKPTDFHGLAPKLAVRVGDEVKAGSALFYDKYQPDVKFVSPKSGKVIDINRGERRMILEVVVEGDNKDVSEQFPHRHPSDLERNQVKELLCKSGLWPSIKMRPYGIIAKVKDTPNAVFISCFSSAPLAPDYDFILDGEDRAWQTGIDALRKLTDGKVHLGLAPGFANKMFTNTEGVEITRYAGPHPSGNVGVQIHAVSPTNKGDVVWTIEPQDVVAIGRLFINGVYDASRIVALAGSEVKNPVYYRTWRGACIDSILKQQVENNNVRVIGGDVLTGTNITKSPYVGYYDSLVSVIPEGDYYEPFGWALPGFGKFSASRTFFSWLIPGKKEYTLDSNLHGEERAFVVSEEYEKVVPMDILPVYLLKAILANDIDRMEQLGIYEVIEEDLALCEFVCTSKIQVQDILRKGINIMIKELG